MDNNNYDEKFTISSVLIYIKENFIGLSLLLLAFFIIYIVDHINQFNIALFSTPSPIAGISNTKSINIPKTIFRGKKHKKH